MFIRQFFAALTILSFTLTQALPAAALEREGRAALRPQMDKAGLEEALQAAAGERDLSKSVTAPDVSEDFSEMVRGFLPPLASRAVGERVAALKEAGGPFDSPRGRQRLPAAATDLMRRLALAVSNGVLTLDEAKDPMLALALLAPGDWRLQKKAKRTVQERERLCANCAEHALHEIVSAEELTVVEHGVLDLLSAVATALDLIVLKGELRQVDVMTGVDHGTEIARTAQTVSWLHQVVGGALAVPGRVDLTRENLARLAGLDAPVVALVSHTRTPGWNADHYVSILQVDPETDVVVYLDNGERKTNLLDDFINLHAPQDGQAVFFLDAVRAERLRAAGLSWRALSQRDSAALAGACGIILHVGRYSQEGGLGSAFDAAYRGKDNTGEIVVEPSGLRRATVQGSPSALVKSFQLLGQGYPEEAMVWYLEANPDISIPEDLEQALEALRGGKVLTDRQRYLIHRKWRTLTQRETIRIQDFILAKSNQTLREQGLGWVRPERLDVVDPATGHRRPAVKDDLYRISFYSDADEAQRDRKKLGDVRMDNAVGQGKRGWPWSGRWIHLQGVSEAADWTAWQEALLDAVQQFRGLYRYDLTTIREILRYELADTLTQRVAQGQVTQAEAVRMEGAFVRHFEQVWARQSLKKPAEETTWKAAWTVLSSELVRIAGHVSPDPVRHSFRIQGSLVASIFRNPAWADRVQQIFQENMPASREGRSWYDDWRVESNTGTPGLAFAAVTKWFQEKYMPPEQMGKIEIGHMDAFTLAHMHIVDRKLRHDRWATTGSRIPKDAQPVTDTGLLSNVNSTALREIMEPVRRRYRREVRRREREERRTLTAEEKTAVLRYQFSLLLQAYLEAHPEMRGTPARGFAHNGDLSPSVQNGILPLLRANGYFNEQTRVDAETGEVRREQILTDTWKLGALVEFIFDAWRKDRALGWALDTDGMHYPSAPPVSFMPREYHALWNAIQTKLHSQRMEFTPEEIALRVALLEFSRGVMVTPGKASSEIALGWVSLYDPALDGVVSHRRAVELVVVRDADENLQVQYTSDALTAVRMFDPEQVETAIEKDTKISADLRNGIYDLVRRRKLAQTEPKNPEALDADQFEQQRRLLVAQARDAEKKAGAFQAELSLTLKGEEKFVKVRKVWSAATSRFEAEMDITDFKGLPLAIIRPGREPEINDAERENIRVHRKRTVTIAAASKGGFATFGTKEIDSQLSALTQMHVYAGVRGNDSASLDITRQGLRKTAYELTALVAAPSAPGSEAGLEEAEGGLNRETLTRFIGNALRTGQGTNVRTGVGSSENDSSAARAIYRHLLPMLGYDNITPSRVVSTAAHYDPESTLAEGITWSGATALTLLALQWLKSQGVAVAGLTGNPTLKDIADIVESSAGTVHARTKKEVAVYTTVGFTMLLEGLFEDAIQQNLIAEQAGADESVRADLRRRREEIWGDYASMVEKLAEVLRDPERDYFREGSRMSRVTRHFSKLLGMRFIGDYYNNPIVDEIGIKVGETRNINFTSYDYRSYGYRSSGAKGSNVGWFLNATSLNRIREATEVLREARRNGVSLIVQTFDPETLQWTEEERERYGEDWKAFLEELTQLEGDFNGQVSDTGEQRPLAVRFTVPRVHFTLQPMLDVITGQMFGVGLALAAGYSNEATDGPRNLAKAVTVLGVQLAFGALMTVDRFLSLEAQDAVRRVEEMKAFQAALAARWGALSSGWERGLHRLPVRAAELVQGLRLGGDFHLEETTVRRSFGPTLSNLRRIVILYDTDEAAEVAGRMAGIPLANSEVVLSDSQDDKLFAEVQDKETNKYLPREYRRAINGREATIRFVRSQSNRQAENRIRIQFDGEAAPAIEFSGDERGILGAIQAQAGVDYDPVTQSMILAGRRYVLKVLGKRGISLTATQPDLLGVPVELHRPTDFTLEQDTDVNTLVVAISRSNHKGVSDHEVAGISSAETGRSPAEKAQTASKGIPEGSIVETLQALRGRGVPVFTVGDQESVVHTMATHGSVELDGSDLDSMSVVAQYYASLLLLGARLGEMRGVPDAPAYEQALEVVPNILVRTLESLYTEDVETGVRLFWPDVAGVTVNIGHAPTTGSYTPDPPAPGQGVTSGTVQITRGTGEEKQTLLGLKVKVTDDQITGIQDPQPQYLIGGRPYRIAFDKARGIVFRGVEPDYVRGGSLRDALVSLRQNRFPGQDGKTGKQYRSWGVIGGVQDRAGAAAIALALERAGYQARHLEVDESVHGWYALINDAVQKFPDLFFREGVSPDFDPDNMEDGQQEGKDVGIVILATDTRTFGASIVDAQRARTRNARIILVVKESDRNNEEVVNAGAHLVLTVPDTFNEMVSFAHDLIGQALARELARSEEPAYAYEPGSERAALALLPSVEMRRVALAREGIHPFVQDRVETELEGRGRTPQQVERFVGLFASRRAGNLPLVTHVQQEGPYHCVYAVFPYREAADRPNPQGGIRDNLNALSQVHRGRDMDPHDVFVTAIDGEEAPEDAFVRIELVSAEDAEFARTRMAVAVAPYSAVAVAPVAPPAPAAVAEFDAVLEEVVRFLNLPREDSIRQRTLQALQGYQGTGEPQVLLLSHPSEGSQSLVVVVDANRSGLASYVDQPIARVGGNSRIFADIIQDVPVRAETGQVLTDVELMVLHVRNRDVDVLKGPVDKIRRTLRGFGFPTRFADQWKPHLERMPKLPLDTLYGAYLDAVGLGTYEVRLSDEVADPTRQSALVVILPETDRYTGVAGRIQQRLAERGVVQEQADVVYAEEEERPGRPAIRFLRFILSGLVDSPAATDAMQLAEEIINGEAAPAEAQAPPPTTGLEEALAAESPLDLPLPDRWPTYQEVIGRLRQAREISGFLETVRDRLREGVGVPSGYRALDPEEIRALEANRVSAVDGWQRVYVPADFGIQDIKRMFNVRLGGTVVLGRLLGTAALDPKGSPLESHIENTNLRDVVLGDDVLMESNTLVERYVVGDRAVITHNRELTAEKGTTFGIGVAIPVGPETGGRAFKAYPEMLFDDVMRLVASPKDPERKAYEEEHAEYVEAAKADFGYIGAGAVVSGNGTARNLFVADAGVVVDTAKVENLILLGEESGSEQSRVEGAGEVLNVMAQQGVKIGPQAVVIGTDAKKTGVLLLEHSHAEGALVQDSVIAPNSGAGRGAGEVTSAVMGPFTGMHHSSILIAAVLAGMGNIGAEAAIHSNHTSRQPSEEFWGGEGDFYGLNTSYSGTANLQDAPYSIWAKVNALAQVMAMPFSLVQEPTITIPGSSPGLMQITPGWVWSDNAYAILRNEGKYAKRDKAKRHRLGLDDLQRRPYEVLRPSVVNKMIRARDALRSVDAGQARRGVIPTEDPNNPTIVPYFTEKEIPGLGKNFMTERDRVKAVETYNFMLQYYALRGLYEQAKSQEAFGQMELAAALVSTPSSDLRWEHERRTFLQELPGVSVAGGLQQFAQVQTTLRNRVREARDRDNQRGEKYLPGYNEVHDPADDDTFVKQITAETEAVAHDADRIVAALAGLEEEIFGRREAIGRIADFVEGELAARRTGVEVSAQHHTDPTPMSASGQELTPVRIEDLVDFSAGGLGQVAIRFGGAYGNQITIRPVTQAGEPYAGLEEAAEVGTLRAARLPQESASVQSGVNIIAGPHITGLAIGAALSKVATRDGTRAAQVVFVVEDADKAARVQALAEPMMVFSAADYGGSVETAVAAARELLPDAEELGTDNQPVPEEIQQLLWNLFGIEINLDVELKAWRDFIRRATLAIQA